jgi:hypothetical protein
MFEWDTDGYRAEEDRQRAALREKHAPWWVGPSCRAGWLGLLDTFYATARLVVPAGLEDQLRVRQIKEKFGALCIYYHDSDRLSDEVRAAISVASHAAEGASLYTCEVCGRPGVLRVRHGWYATRCDEHADGAEPWQPEQED